MNNMFESALRHYRTPMYIFDIDQLIETIASFRKITRDNIGLCFAMKANPFIVEQAAELVDRIEVCSAGEFNICRDKKIPVEKVLISGVLKKDTEFIQILNYYKGRCLVSIESPQQFQIVEQWSNENAQPVDVLLRLSSGNQFGMDEEAIFQIIKYHSQRSFINLKGIHYFSGTQKRIDKTLSELQYLDHFFKRVEDLYNVNFEILEFGPGLSVSLFQEKKSDPLEDLKKICHAINLMTWQGKVTLEMGRALTAQCGTYLTRVIDIKKTGNTYYAIVDGGMHHLHYDGQIRGMFHPDFQILSKKTLLKSSIPWCICGALCTTNDILIQKYNYALSVNDVLAFRFAGAYTMTEGMSLFLSHSLPEIYLYSQKAGFRQIRGEIPTYLWNMSQEEEYGKIN